MTYSYNSLRDDANPNSKTNQNNGTTSRNEPQYAVYIALAVFRYVPYNTEQSIKDEIERLTNNIENKDSTELFKIRNSAWQELKGLLDTTKINKFGSSDNINPKYTEKQKNYQALSSITATMEFIKEYTYQTGPLKEKMQEHFFNMITHFDNNNKIKTNFSDRKEIAYDTKMNYTDKTLTEREKKIEYLVVAYNKINKTPLKYEKTAYTKTQQEIIEKNAEKQKAAERKLEEQATAQETEQSITQTEPTYNKSTRKTIGEYIGYYILENSSIYNEHGLSDIYVFYRKNFDIESPEIIDGFPTVRECCDEVIKNVEFTGENIFDHNQDLDMTKFADAVIKHIIDKKSLNMSVVDFKDERKKIGLELKNYLRTLINITKNKNGGFIDIDNLNIMILDSLNKKEKELEENHKPTPVVQTNKQENNLGENLKKFFGLKKNK